MPKAPTNAPPDQHASLPVTPSDVTASAAAIRGSVIVTECDQSRTLSEICGCNLWLKFENLQFTSTFKERGAPNRLLALSPDERQRGVIAMSAGNHAQGVAYHANRLGIPASIVMPVGTPMVKIENTRRHGAEIIILDCSSSMGSPHSKIETAMSATRKAIDRMRDGTWFAILAGTSHARMVYPELEGDADDDAVQLPALARASWATRAQAKSAVTRLTPNGGTRISTWLALARRLFESQPATIRHAILPCSFAAWRESHHEPAVIRRYNRAAGHLSRRRRALVQRCDYLSASRQSLFRQQQ